MPSLAQRTSPRGFASLPDARWPGRIVVSGRTLEDFVAISEEPHADAGWTLRVFQSVSVPSLQIRAQWREVGPATEWVPVLVNNSHKLSGRVSSVRSLAASWPTRGPVDLHENNGSTNTPDDFIDRTNRDIGVVELLPNGGRSSDGVLPFFALTDGHDSLALGIGWSGQWCATLRHADGLLEVEIGLPNVGFVMRPWESLRLPSILLARAPGATADQARRLVRTHLHKHVIPRSPNGQSPSFTTYSRMHELFHGDPVMNDAVEIAALERAAAMGFETYWIDANWYGNTTTWWDEVGNWFVRASELPRGLRPISDRAHELGMKFVFWMEPERARADSEWARTHPDLFLNFGENYEDLWRKENLVVNLGDPRAVDLVFDKISSLITEFNADVFRLDFNTEPLTAWYAADAPNRVGITEIRYIEGLYALWDRLLAAHPGLLIDSCASGGRRIDLETMRRSVPLWRTDYVMGQEPDKMDAPNQTHSWGLGHWVADSLGHFKRFDAYTVRSGLSTGFMAYCALPEAGTPEYADAIAAVAESKRLRPLLSEERIALIAPSLEKETWVALQHHRHADSSGFIVALRGPGADSDSVTLSPEHIEANATYQVIKSDNYLAAAPVKLAGSVLQKLLVNAPQPRSSVLIEYQRV